MGTRGAVAIVLGIAAIIGLAFALLANRSFEVARERPPEPIVVEVRGDLGRPIASRPIIPVPPAPGAVLPTDSRTVRLPGPVFQPSPAPRIRPQRPPPARATPSGPAIPPAARAPSRCLEELGIPPSYTGVGRPGDHMASAAAARDGRLHLGVGAIGNVWSEPYTFAPTTTDVLALAWAGIRHGFNPNALAAIGIKESRYACTRYGDGCFQIEMPTFAELQRQYPRALRHLTHSAVQDRAPAPSLAALHFRFDEHLFDRWYPWAAFHAEARDGASRVKLLARAYNRGAWDRAIGEILTSQYDRCAAASDILTCFDDHAIARDHAQSVAAYAVRLQALPGDERTVPWPELAVFLESGVRPLARDADWPRLLTLARTGYDCLQATDRQFRFSREAARFFTWFAALLPPLEVPQAMSDYRAPVAASTVTAPPSPSGPASGFRDTFSGSRERWATQFEGYGTIEVRDSALVLRPQAATRPGETHAALVTAQDLQRDERLTFSYRTRTTRQLRTNSTPNPWEVGWTFFHYQGLTSFYSLILKPNGIELGKKHASDAQIFLATRETPQLRFGEWATITITSEVLRNADRRIRVSVNGTEAIDYTDTAPLRGGTVALYTEDAEAWFDDVAVE